MLAALPPTEYPLTVDVADAMGAYGSDHQYDFVLDQLLDGLRGTTDAAAQATGCTRANSCWDPAHCRNEAESASRLPSAGSHGAPFAVEAVLRRDVDPIVVFVASRRGNFGSGPLTTLRQERRGDRGLALIGG